VFGFHDVLLGAWQNAHYSRAPVLNGMAQNVSVLGELHWNDDPDWCARNKKLDF
jgi:hypothetical protein